MQPDSSAEPTASSDHPSAAATSSNPAPAGGSSKRKKKYIPAVTPRLRIALMIVFGLFALLAANSAYLSSITILEAITGLTYQDFFYMWMFLLHLVLGLIIITPFLVFAGYHLLATRKRKNRRAVRIGYALLTVCLILLISGILLTRVGDIELKHALTRQLIYWAHVICPLAAIWLYWLHRLAGPPIKWKVGLRFAVVVGVILIPMIYLQFHDPRQWSVAGSPDGYKYFQPSKVVTTDGNFIPESSLMNDDYCLPCHQDVHEDWSHSAHRFSSFNNPAYLTSVVELREILEERDGDVKASRWCAGCHDPVPFLSGKFDNPDFDFINDPTAHAGITCTVCHAVTNVNSNIGNADFTIEEPIHYPFAYSQNGLLQWINHTLVKAKPSFHKKTMLKPLHKTTEFCAACHKVHLPKELTQYKEFLRGQNHYDSFLLSGVSGHGLRSFYYPPEAETSCNRCHMPLVASTDFGAQDFDGTQINKVHDHLFPSANTALPWLRNVDEVIKAHEEFNKGVMRVDVFGIKEGDAIEAPLIGPIRPDVPTLEPGKLYLLETVIRTLKMGHHFTQGTADSNEIWMDVTVIENATYDESGKLTSGKIIGRSGGMDDHKAVDPGAHFVNVFMLDKNGDRINRRNAQDIFVPLYNHQIPPGAGQVVHYRMRIPPEVSGPVTVDIKLQFRKFDQEYMDIVHKFHRDRDLPLRGELDGDTYINDLPIMTLATDRVTFPVAGNNTPVDNPAREIPAWQRWNDYGIGLLLESLGESGRGELRQAEEAFKKVQEEGQFHGPINLARVYQAEGRLDDAVLALRDALEFEDQEKYPAWTVLWLTGVINRQQGYLDKAIDNLSSALSYRTPETATKNFDFSKDYVVINELGQTLFERSFQENRAGRVEREMEYLRRAEAEFLKVLEIDSENVNAHYSLAQVYERLNEPDKASHHRQLHQIYEPDYNAGDTAIVEARRQYPLAREAAEAVTIYKLRRENAPELPPSQYDVE